VVAVVLLTVITMAGQGTSTPTGTSPTGGGAADSFIPDERTPASCADGDLTCLGQAYGNVAYADGPIAAMDALAADQRPLAREFCHRIIHRIGAAALLRSPEAPGAVLAAGRPDCASGFYHGVLQHLFLDRVERTPSTMSGLGWQICQEEVVRTDRALYANCLHGIGHGALIAFDYDLTPATAVCSSLTKAWAREWCYSGLYMEYALPAYGSDIPWSATLNDPTYPCGGLTDGQGKGSCYQSLVISSLLAADGDLAGPAAACAAAEARYRFLCFAAMGSQVDLSAGASSVATACAQAGDYFPTCIYGALRFQAATDGTLVAGAAFCADPERRIDRATCLQAIGSGIVGLVESPAIVEWLCGEALPLRADVERCVAGATGRAPGE
jgi:hypothetical protein